MKTASLSQGTCVTVITKAAGKSTLVRRWDVAHIRNSGKWELLIDTTPIAALFVEKIDKMHSGTAVIVEDTRENRGMINAAQHLLGVEKA
jgi:ABC-type phosphate/phosphonate transport system ATPase subunit